MVTFQVPFCLYNLWLVICQFLLSRNLLSNFVCFSSCMKLGRGNFYRQLRVLRFNEKKRPHKRQSFNIVSLSPGNFICFSFFEIAWNCLPVNCLRWPGPNFTELLSTQICSALSFCLDKKKYNQPNLHMIFRISKQQLNSMQQMEIWLVILFLSNCCA